MAQPIPLKRIPSDPAREVRARLEAASVEHADAIVSVYALLQELQDHGVLDLLRGLTGSGADVVTRLSEAADRPESIAAIRNLISMARILASIDPEMLHALANAVTKAPEPKRETPGWWKILRGLGSKESRRAVGAMVYGVQVFGRVLIEKEFKKS